MKNEELKQCPFCGGKAELYESEAYNLKTENMEKDIRWFVMCGRCTALTCGVLKGKAIEALSSSEIPNSSDTIYRQVAIDAFLTELTKRERKNLLHTWSTVEVKYFVADMLEKLPSVQPTYTDEQIQRMQNMEQAQLDKAFELGQEDAKPIVKPERKKDIVQKFHDYQIDWLKSHYDLGDSLRWNCPLWKGGE